MPLPISASEILSLYGGPSPFQILWYRGKYGLPSGTIRFSDFQKGSDGCIVNPNTSNPVSFARGAGGGTGAILGVNGSTMDFVTYETQYVSRTYYSKNVLWWIPLGYAVQYEKTDQGNITVTTSQAGPFYGTLRMYSQITTSITSVNGSTQYYTYPAGSFRVV